MKYQKLIIIILALVFISGCNLVKRNNQAQKTDNQQPITNLSSPSSFPQEEMGETSINLKISSPQEEENFNTSRITVSGNTSPNAEVFINDKELKADKNGLFKTSLDLEEGENYLFISANDEWGNFAEAERTVYYNIEE